MSQYDLVVIGGGSAGLVVAGGTAQLGARVALVEKKALGGDCLYTGCVPSKTFIRSARFAADVRRAKDFGFATSSLEFKDGAFASITDRVARVIEAVGEHDRLATAGGRRTVMGVKAGCTPRGEVLEGELNDALFAANFGRLIRNEGPPVYREPALALEQ